MSPLEQLVYYSPRWVVVLMVAAPAIAGFFVGAVMARIAARRGAKLDADDSHWDFFLTATNAVLALMVGFTFSIALGLFQERRVMVVDEANAVMQTFNLSRAVSNADHVAIRQALIDYTQARISAAQANDITTARRFVAQGQVAEARMLDLCLAPALAEATDISSGLASSAADLQATSTRRLAFRRAHIPIRVYGIMLLSFALVGFGVGYQHGGVKGGRSLLPLVLLVVAVAVLMLVIDLDRPMNSAIGEPQVAMIEALGKLKATPAALPASVTSHSPAPTPGP